MNKTANVAYTPDMVAFMVDAYNANPTGETVASLSVKFSKTVRSIIGKLANEGVYQKAELKKSANDKVIRKEGLADAIGQILELSENEADSLTKVNKSALEKIFQALANSKPF